MEKSQKYNSFGSDKVIIHGWVARDGDGSLNFFIKKPLRQKETKSWIMGGIDLLLFSKLFPSITWKSQPLEVEFTINPI